jgi:hypothetical protein
MEPVLVFFGVVVLIGCLLRGILALRLRAIERHVDTADRDLCQLEQARRISSVSIIAALAGLGAAGLASVVVWLF